MLLWVNNSPSHKIKQELDVFSANFYISVFAWCSFKLKWSNFRSFQISYQKMVQIDESQTIEECDFIKPIVVKCKKCLKVISFFSHLKSVSRQCWSIFCYMLHWHINYNITSFGELHCECSNYLGYEADIFELRLIKKNVIIDHWIIRLWEKAIKIKWK